MCKDETKNKLKSAERSREKLYDEVQELKRKLKDQQRLNKETEDKYYRFKDCVYRSRSHLNKLQDEFNEVLKKTENKTQAVKVDQVMPSTKTDSSKIESGVHPTAIVDANPTETNVSDNQDKKNENTDESMTDQLNESEKIADFC